MAAYLDLLRAIGPRTHRVRPPADLCAAGAAAGPENVCKLRLERALAVVVTARLWSTVRALVARAGY